MQVAMAIPILGKVNRGGFSLLFGNTSLFVIGEYYKTNKLNLSEGFLHPGSLDQIKFVCVG
jgi:hypothetical protein